MIRALFCVCCGQRRTLDTTRPCRQGAGDSAEDRCAEARLVCFRCAGTLFTTEADNAPVTPAGWWLTRHDGRFLRSLTIACDGADGRAGAYRWIEDKGARG